MRLVLVALVLLFAPLAHAQAAPALVWGSASDPGGALRFEDGGAYTVPLATSKPAFVDRGNGAAGIGYLYLTQGSTRTLVARIGSGGVAAHAWAAAGSYELDIYRTLIISPARAPVLHERLLAFLAPRHAHAQSSGLYERTIRFTVADAATVAPAVLFIPGFEASRLYEMVAGSEVERWPPRLGSVSDDLSALAFNAKGSSTRRIYTKEGGVLHTVAYLGLYNLSVYASFFAALDKLQAGGHISDWEAFAYDWRESPSAIAEYGTLYDTGVRMLDTEVTKLAADGRKVVIVAHSMGGLVAKALLTKLEREGREGLITKVLFIATPQLGTPQTVGTMLHGSHSPFPGYFITAEEVRQVSENLPSAFALLPSSAYFEAVSAPVVAISATSSLRTLPGFWPHSVTAHGTLRDFITDLGGRTKPAVADIETPHTLSSALFARATTEHSALDTWQPPPGITAVQVAGWGLETPSGERYYDKRATHCVILCLTRTFSIREPMVTQDGDGTVVSPSAAAVVGIPTYYFDILKYNTEEIKRNEHADVLEVPHLQTFIASFISSSTPTITPYVSTTLPTASRASLRLSVHSPVSLEVSDANGRRTGRSTRASGDPSLIFTDEDIPGSSYLELGEEKYIGLPEGSYTALLKGQGSGVFTFKLERIRGGTIEESIVFEGIPVTASTSASIRLAAGNISEPLFVDTNGDGAADISFGARESALSSVYLELLMAQLKSLSLSRVHEVEFKARFGAISRAIKSGTGNPGLLLAALERRIKQLYARKMLTPTQASALLDMVRELSKLLP